MSCKATRDLTTRFEHKETGMLRRRKQHQDPKISRIASGESVLKESRILAVPPPGKCVPYRAQPILDLGSANSRAASSDALNTNRLFT